MEILIDFDFRNARYFVVLLIVLLVLCVLFPELKIAIGVAVLLMIGCAIPFMAFRAAYRIHQEEKLRTRDGTKDN